MICKSTIANASINVIPVFNEIPSPKYIDIAVNTVIPNPKPNNRAGQVAPKYSMIHCVDLKKHNVTGSAAT